MCVLQGSKNFFIPPQSCKTEGAKFHEILTSVCVLGGLKTFLYPVPKLLVCVCVCVCVCLGGLKTFLYPPKFVKLKVPNSMKY